jgi:transcriptional regulator with XRE-family HTH domain
MLNIKIVEATMAARGLNQAALADVCGVSREAVSKWFAGESLPRPAKVRALATALELSVENLISRDTQEPVVAFRTFLREPLSGNAKAKAQEMGRHFKQLQPYVEGARLFSQRVLKEPCSEDGYIQRAVNTLRNSLNLSSTESPSIEQLIELIIDTGAFIVPVIWGKDKTGHENALTIYLPESQTTWVVLSLSAGQDDFKYWLAHELGHCLSLHKLTDEAGESFAERFAQLFVFPDALAKQCLEAMRSSSNPLEEASYFAGRHGVSVVTAVKSADRIAAGLGLPFTGVATQTFYDEWKDNFLNRPTVAAQLFQSDSPTVEDFVEKSSVFFRTEVFDAIGRLQKAQGGHSPAFVGTLLNLDLSQAFELSSYLSRRQP